MNQTSYQPVWPETVIFWGAGATKSIGFHTTADLSYTLYMLARTDQNLKERVQNAFTDQLSEWHSIVMDILILVDDRDRSFEIEDVYKRQFPNVKNEDAKERHMKLLRRYNWPILADIINICPGDEKTFAIQDLFNVLDMHINNGHGFRVPDRSRSDESVMTKFISTDELRSARDALKMLCILIHSIDYQVAIKNKQDIIKQYKSFASILYEMMLQEGMDLLEHGHKMTTRDFYLFSHAFISMNWDPILLWILFNVHKEYNHADDILHVGDPPLPLKFFHDLGHFMGVRRIDGESPAVWYPFNESVVQRVNDEEHQTGRRVRVGKFYFPHGSTAWRECPNCGKLTMFLGDGWSLDDATLFPPHITNGVRFGIAPRSLEETEALQRGDFDAVQCAFCATITEVRDTPLVMQSSFKDTYPSFIEEIQRDMKVSIEKARHIVLMGYTLPSDDVIYRSLLSARKNYQEKIYCSLAVGYISDAPDRWMVGDELEEFIDSIENKKDGLPKAYKTATEIFGKEFVRGYAKGIPAVFLDQGVSTKQRVQELLYPNWAQFTGGHVQR